MQRPGGSGSSTSGYTWKFVLKDGESEDTAPMLYANTRGEIFFNPNYEGGVPCLHALRTGGPRAGDPSGAGPSHLSPVRRMLNDCL